MTIDEAKSVFQEMRDQGETDADIIHSLVEAFKHGDIDDINVLNAYLSILGYGLDPALLKMSPEDQRKFIDRRSK